MSHKIATYTELKQQIHDDLRVQHPEWIEPSGACPTCDSYESRLAQLLNQLADHIRPHKTRERARISKMR